MWISSGDNNNFGGDSDQYSLKFYEYRGGLKELHEKIKHQIEKCKLKRGFWQLAKDQAVIFIYSSNDRKPSVSQFDVFKSIQGNKKCIRAEEFWGMYQEKKREGKHAYIEAAETDDNIKIYWIKYC